MHLDRELHSSIDHPSVKPARCAAVHAPSEHDRDPVETTKRELIRERALKPGPPGGGAIKHARVGDLELAERELIDVPASVVLRGERRR